MADVKNKRKRSDGRDEFGRFVSGSKAAVDAGRAGGQKRPGKT